ncbi:MAG: LCP family protein [Bulleidia sp.]
MRNERTKRKRRISSGFYYLLLIVSAVLFLYTFYKMPMFPLKWTLITAVVLVVVLLVTGLFTLKLKPTNFFQKTVNLLLAVVLCIGSFILPYEEKKITALFETVTGTTVRISVYAMRDSYKYDHPEYFNSGNTIYMDDMDGKKLIEDNGDYLVYGTAMNLDRANQKYAVDQLNMLSASEIMTIDHDSLDQAVNDLYNNTTDLLIMADSYASVIQDTPGFETFELDTQVVYTMERTIESSFGFSRDVSLVNQPFAVFFGGNDQTGSLSLQGRTDVDMIVAVNPNTYQIAIINLPRDSYIPNPYYGGSYDKLTHLGLSGLDNTLDGISDVLGTKIENYVLVNFDTFQTIIEALGGVTINNPYEFTAIDGQHFPEGTIELNPVSALMYVRERYNLPGGDFDRNMHQQIVMQGMIDRITSPEGIIRFNSILDNVKDCVLTNLSGNSIYALIQKQLDEDIHWNIVKYHVEGEMGMEECASAPGQYLSVVYPYDNQIDFVRDVIQQVYDGEILEQTTLPAGES